MTHLIIRIILHYIGVMLVARGLMSQDISDLFSTDPDISAALEMLLGGAFAVLAECWYALARKLGWRK